MVHAQWVMRKVLADFVVEWSLSAWLGLVASDGYFPTKQTPQSVPRPHWLLCRSKHPPTSLLMVSSQTIKYRVCVLSKPPCYLPLLFGSTGVVGSWHVWTRDTFQPDAVPSAQHQPFPGLQQGARWPSNHGLLSRTTALLGESRSHFPTASARTSWIPLYTDIRPHILTFRQHDVQSLGFSHTQPSNRSAGHGNSSPTIPTSTLIIGQHPQATDRDIKCAAMGWNHEASRLGCCRKC